MITQQDVQHFIVVCALIAYALVTIIGLLVGIQGIRKDNSDYVGCGGIALILLAVLLIGAGYVWYSGLPAMRAQ